MDDLGGNPLFLETSKLIISLSDGWPCSWFFDEFGYVQNFGEEVPLLEYVVFFLQMGLKTHWVLGSLRWMLNIYFLKRDSMSQPLKNTMGTY